MPEPDDGDAGDLGDRLRRASGRPQHALDVGAVAGRASQLDRRARRTRVAAAAVAAVVLAGAGLVAVSARTGDSTRVAAGPPAAPSAPSQELLAATRDNTLVVLSAADGHVVRTIPFLEHPVPVTGPIAVSPDGRTAYLTIAVTPACEDVMLDAVDLATGAVTSSTHLGSTPAVSPDGTKLAYVRVGGGCTAGTVVVRDLTTGAESQWNLADDPSLFQGAVPHLASLAWSHDGRQLVFAAGATSPHLAFLDISQPVNPSNPKTVAVTQPQPIHTPAGDAWVPEVYDEAIITADGKVLADAPGCQPFMFCAIALPDTVFVVDPATGVVVGTFIHGTDDRLAGVHQLVLDPSGTRLAAVASGATPSEAGNLTEITGGTLRLIASNIAAAAWLPIGEPAPAPTQPATTTSSTPAATPTSTTPTTAARPGPAKDGDVDGDGTVDTVSISWTSTQAMVTAELSHLGEVKVPVTVNPFLLSAQAQDRPAILGLADLDSDGKAEIVVQVDHGASVSVFEILTLDGNTLAPATTAGGGPAQFTIAGSVGSSFGFGCGGGQVVQVSWTNAGDFKSFEGTRTVSTLHGTRLTTVATTHHTFATPNGQPPTRAQLAAAGYDQHCPPIT